MIRFDEWVEVSAMESLVELENEHLNQNKQLWGNKGRSFREAWVAVNFAKPFGASHVFLPTCDSKGPDFLVKRNDDEYAFQTVEVLSTNRKRGAEAQEVIKEFSDEYMDEVFQDIPDALRRAVNKKLGKYPKMSLGLVLYLNTSAFVLEHERPQVEQWIIQETKPCLKEFISVFVLWNNRRLQIVKEDALLHI
jgi:hypothetical protein